MAKTLKIAIASTTGFHLVHLARELLNQGHDVTYYSYHPPYRIRQDGINSTHHRSLFYSLLPNALPALVRHLPNVQRHFVEKMLRLTDELVAEKLERCDVFIGLSGMALKAASMARKKYNAKVIIDRGASHVLTQALLLSGEKDKPLSDFYISRELASYDNADYIALPSHHSVQSFLDHNFRPEKLFHNQYGVNISRFQPTARPAGKFTLLFVGAWSYQKGADVLSNAIEMMPDVKLIHVGTIKDVPFPNTDRFQSLGHIPNDQLSSVYANCHALILPSRQDGFGMVLLEALACGLPVIASEKTGGVDIKDVVKQEAMVQLIAPESTAELIKAVNILREQHSSQRIGDIRTALVEQDLEYYTWAAYARRYMKFIKSVH